MSLIKDGGRREKDVHRGNTNFQSPTNMRWERCLLKAVCSQEVSHSHEGRQKRAACGTEEAVEDSCLEEGLNSDSSTIRRTFGFSHIQEALDVQSVLIFPAF